jgi:hypothetical protein
MTRAEEHLPGPGENLEQENLEQAENLKLVENPEQLENLELVEKAESRGLVSKD